MEPSTEWLIDVDGVINSFSKPGWKAAPRKIWIGDYKVRWAPRLITRIHEIQTTGAVQLRWSTTWCGDPADLDRLGGILRLRLPYAFGERPPHKTWGDLKAEAALDVLAQGKRLIWTDDTEVNAGRLLFPQIARAEREGRALLIQPRSNRGLQPEDLDAIEAFATEAWKTDRGKKEEA